MSLIQAARTAMANHSETAQEAVRLLNSWYAAPLPRVAGMDTVIRMAIRLERGLSVAEAAAAEYVYRWRLAIKAPDQCGAAGRHDPRDSNSRACVPIFGAPHLLGM